MDQKCLCLSCLTLVDLLKDSSTSNTRTKHRLSNPITHFVFNCCLLVLIQMHFNQLRTIQLNTNTFANNLSWEDQIVEDVVVDSGQCTATWSLLFVWVWTSTLRFRQDFTLCAENDMTTSKFLFQFTNQASLDLLESLLLGDWNVDNDSLRN